MTAHSIDTEALRRLADGATSAPWSAMDFEPDPEDWGTPILGGGERGTMQAHMIGYAITVGDEAQCDADAAFIAAARTAVPALLDENAALRARIKAVERLTYASDDGTKYEHNGHGPAEGEPECPGCWALGIRRALDG